MKISYICVKFHLKYALNEVNKHISMS